MILPEAKIIHYSRKSFTHMHTYWDQFYYGQLKFFKLTKSKIIFMTAKLMIQLGTILRILYKLDKRYFTRINVIKSI